MEAVWSLLKGQDRNIGRKQIVETPFQDMHRIADLSRRLDVHHLAERVHSRIGSTGTLQVHVMIPKYLGNRLSHFPHHGAGILLLLPPAVPGAVILQDDFESGHGRLGIESELEVYFDRSITSE